MQIYFHLKHQRLFNYDQGFNFLVCLLLVNASIASCSSWDSILTRSIPRHLQSYFARFQSACFRDWWIIKFKTLLWSYCNTVKSESSYVLLPNVNLELELAAKKIQNKLDLFASLTNKNLLFLNYKTYQID